MKFSSRERVGLRAMVELARYHGEGPVPLSTIAAAQALPLPYLERIAGALRRSGLITSVRGARGGYLLARAPARISVGDIFRALEGGLTSLDCLQGEGAGCDREEVCAARAVWEQVEHKLAQTLDHIALDELSQRAGRRDICPNKGDHSVQEAS